MTPRQMRWLTDGIALVSLALLVGAVWMAHSLPGNRMGLGELAATLSEGSVLFVLGFGGVGWLLARRLPGNAVGWSFALGGLMWAAGAAGDAWGDLAAAGFGEVSALARMVTNLSAFSWLWAMPLSVQLPLLLLPNGRLLSARWRRAVAVLGAGVVLGTLGLATIPGVIEATDPARHLVNPLGVRWLGPLPIVVGLTGAGLLIVGMLAGAIAVVLRFRRSRGVERQQMRWVAAGGCCVLTAPITALIPILPDGVDSIVASLAILAVPVCVGVAVLRYHLYDLGRIISRTLSYAVVTAVLVGLYVAGVTGAARLAPGNSSLAVAASTLAVAALFQPLRQRVQSAVDHRFNRARYDADRTVDAFTRRLRDEVDLDAVRTDLLQVVHGTMQPTTAGLWLRDGAR